MPTFTRVVVVTLGLLFGIMASAAPVDGVVSLCKAGMSEDIVVIAAMQQSTSLLTAEQMIAVKSACGENVLRALMQAAPPVSGSAPAINSPVENGGVISSTKVKVKSLTSSAVGIFKRGEKGGDDDKVKEKDEATSPDPDRSRLRLHISAKNAEVGGEEFTDKTLADSVSDLKGAAGKKFVVVVVDNEAEADLKLVVLSRQYEQVRSTIMRHKTPRTEGILNCALYRREGGGWKPTSKLRSQSLYWKDAASKMIGEVDKAVR